MEFFFGQVDLKFYNNVDPSELFEHQGKHYWYRAIVNEEQVCFYDTCNRHFPVSLEDCDSMHMVLALVVRQCRNEQELKHIRQKMQEEVDYMARQLRAR